MTLTENSVQLLELAAHYVRVARCDAVSSYLYELYLRAARDALVEYYIRSEIGDDRYDAISSRTLPPPRAVRRRKGAAPSPPPRRRAR